MKILQPPHWARPRGYSNGVMARGQMVFVAGMIGWDAQCVFHTDDMAGQVRQALSNVVEVLLEAGARPEHIVRMTWYVTDRAEYVAAYPETTAQAERLRDVLVANGIQATTFAAKDTDHEKLNANLGSLEQVWVLFP